MLWLCLMIWQVQVIPLKWEEEIAQRVKIFFHLLVIKAFTLFLFLVWIYSPYHFLESHQEASLKIDEDEVQSRKWSLIVSNKTIASDTWEIADGRCQRPLNWEMPRGFCRTLTSLIIRILSDLSPYASFFLFFFPSGGTVKNSTTEFHSRNRWIYPHKYWTGTMVTIKPMQQRHHRRAKTKGHWT